MSFCRKSLLRIFLLFCLVAMMCQRMFLHDLNLIVKGARAKGEPTSTMYRSIDVYTQKEPYSGRGPNQPSDAFAPQEEVILYAYATYRDDPVPGKIVAFEVHGPVNRFENLSFTQTAVTDANGIANVSFRITWPNGHHEEEVFGVWNVIAVVDIAEVAVNDTLSFLVGCIVRVTSVETVDSNNVSRTSFMKNEHMSFRLNVENIAMTEKVATLIIDVYDNLSIFLGQVVLADQQIVPGVTVMVVQDLLIPQWASIGEGVVYANAYTALPALGGIPWCHDVSTTFSIVKIIVHDVAVVDVKPSVSEVFSCQSVNVSVVVRNEGNVAETFDVSAYYDSNLIGTFTVRNLAPQKEKHITFKWCTLCLEPGDYTLSAEASVVPGEIDVEDNRFVNGIVTIKPWTPLPPTPAECVVPKWLLASLFLLAVLIGANLVVTVGFVLWWLHKREKKEKTEPVISAAPSRVKPLKEQAFKQTKTCNVCGREFSGAYTFCPHCMSFHDKDDE
jgi:hypothetical protein